MNAVANVSLIAENVLHLPHRPGVTLVFRLVGILVGIRPIALEVEPSRCRDLLGNQSAGDFLGPNTAQGQIVYLLYNPSGFLINQQMPFLIWVFHIPNRRASAIVCAIGKPCTERRLDLFAGLPGVHFIQNIEEWGQLILTVKGVYIVIHGNITHTFAGKVNLRILAGQDVVATKTG